MASAVMSEEPTARGDSGERQASAHAVRRWKVLIAGAGIAGPSLAYWLLRAGMSPVLVDSAPGPRAGGYMIDIWGPGFAAAERMGLGPRLREIGYRIQDVRVVDARGRTSAKLEFGRFEKSLGDGYISVMRGDLAAAVSSSLRGRVATRYNDEVVGLTQAARAVEVAFRRGRPRRFDLVIGADGLHSSIRRLAFSNGSWEAPLGYYVAAFTVAGYPHADSGAYVSRTTRGRQVARYSLRDGRTTLFMIVATELARGAPLDTESRQRAFLRETFAGVGWEARDILFALDRADELYFDVVSQVRMADWSTGRVALVGDAAYCPSLLAGEGASLAMAGAMVLAGELAQSWGDYRTAFNAYERRLRRYIERKQRSALGMAGWFAPRTDFGLLVRDQLTRLAGIPGVSQLIAGPMLASNLALPSYDWPR